MLSRWAGRHRAVSTRAAVVSGYGPADKVVSIASVDLPDRPAPDCVRVRVHAASINSLDVRMRDGYGRACFESMRSSPSTFVTGFDCSGVVEDVGAHVMSYRRADAVFGVCSPLRHNGRGTFADLVDLPVEFVAPKPEHLSDVEAAAIPFAAMTAASAIHGIDADRVAVLGGSGGVGLFAIQMLKHAGRSNSFVVASCSQFNKGFCAKAGADKVIDYGCEALDDVVEHGSLDAVIDASGQCLDLLSDERPMKCLKPGGVYRTLSSPLLRSCDEHGNPIVGATFATADLVRQAARVYAERCLKFQWSFFTPRRSIWDSVVRMTQDNVLRPHIASVFPLEDMARAQEHLEAHHPPGKVVIDLTQS
ncbi:Enoyl reductase (ER) domain-containing protein [Plasmodiophora brassicae]|nr:hypothetical protein PBRA_007075 [Plasmodiophora brassicae]